MQQDRHDEPPDGCDRFASAQFLHTVAITTISQVSGSLSNTGPPPAILGLYIRRVRGTVQAPAVLLSERREEGRTDGQEAEAMGGTGLFLYVCNVSEALRRHRSPQCTDGSRSRTPVAWAGRVEREVPNDTKMTLLDQATLFGANHVRICDCHSNRSQISHYHIDLPSPAHW